MSPVACCALIAAILAAGARCDVAATGRTAAGACPVHAVGKRLVDAHGRTVYRYPGYTVHAAQIKCSGRTVWVLFHGGVGSSQEAYLGVLSGDAGRTWKALLAEPYFGLKAPFTIDSYSGPWTIGGPKNAYFTGWCPACGYGTESLTVTRDGGKHFRRYALRRLTGFIPIGVRAAGGSVAVTGLSQFKRGPRRRTVTVRLH